MSKNNSNNPDNSEFFVITNIQIVPIRPDSGLIGFATITLNDALFLGSISIRLTKEGAIRLLWPTKRLKNGKLTPYFLPMSELSEKIYQAIEDEIRRLNLFEL